MAGHYLQNANDDGYTSAGTESFTAKTDSSVTPEVKTYAGFTQSFDTLSYEVAPISLLSVDAAAGATPISFTAPEQ